MDDFLKLQNVLLAIQEKYADYFLDNENTIMDYVDITDNPLVPLLFKNGLPAHIIGEICDQLKKPDPSCGLSRELTTK